MAYQDAVYKVTAGAELTAVAKNDIYLAALHLIGDREQVRSFDLPDMKVSGTVRTDGTIVEMGGVTGQEFSAEIEFDDDEGTQQKSAVRFVVPTEIVAGAQKTTLSPTSIESSLTDTGVSEEFLLMKPK